MHKQDMSDNRDDDEIVIRNQDTLARRAWVESALEGVRRRLQLDDEPPLDESRPARPPLFVVRPPRKR
jgi:hypothetical protein